MGDPKIEIEKTREELVREAGDIIYKNLVDNGFAQEIVAHSNHAIKPFQSSFYNNVFFQYQYRASSFFNGIEAKPLLGRDSAEEVTLKVDNLYADEARQVETVSKIWAGVGEEHKKALISTAIDYQMTTHQGTIDGADKARELVGDETVDKFVEISKRTVGVLKKLQAALVDNSIKMKIFPEDGVLGAFVDEKSEEFKPVNEIRKLDINTATLGDIKYTYLSLKEEVSEERRNELNLQFGVVIESFLGGMGLKYNGRFLWDALKDLPDGCTLPDDTREKLGHLLDWIKEQFGIEVLG